MEAEAIQKKQSLWSVFYSLLSIASDFPNVPRVAINGTALAGFYASPPLVYMSQKKELSLSIFPHTPSVPQVWDLALL